jgi:hypothetical protein
LVRARRTPGRPRPCVARRVERPEVGTPSAREAELALVTLREECAQELWRVAITLCADVVALLAGTARVLAEAEREAELPNVQTALREARLTVQASASHLRIHALDLPWLVADQRPLPRSR